MIASARGQGATAGWVRAWLAPPAGPVFVVVCLQAWRAGVRHYRSTGS